jgi:hypothetical protein
LEIIAELLLQIAGFILRILGELILQMIFEAVGELAIHSVKEPFRRPKPIHPLLAAIGYAIFGALAGGLSVWLFPHLYLEAQGLRIVNLIVTPIAAGGLMAGIGAWRRRRDKEVVRLETFAYGYCFALAMAVVRFVWGV